MKYDKVVEMNQKIGKQNARIVEKEIERMIENGERVTVAALQRYTGFSNSFFYKNKLVREILYEARHIGNKVRVIIRSRLLLIKLWKKS